MNNFNADPSGWFRRNFLKFLNILVKFLKQLLVAH